MGAIFSYSIASSLLLAAMYLAYKWMLAGENQHRYNRAVLWVIYLVALVMPVLAPALENIGAGQVEIAAASIGIDMPQASVIEVSQPLLPRVLLGAYVAGMAVAFLCTVIVAVRLAGIVTAGEKHAAGRYTLVIIDNRDVAPFSWLRYIVMSRADYEASGAVISVHETRHLNARHWADLVAAQAVAIFQWYNPAAWLMREELKTVHEYQADEAVMASGSDLRQYQMLLIKKAVGARFPSLANSLNHSKLKKRVTMMYKSKSSVAGRLRALALIPAGALALFVTNLPAVASALSEASAAELAVSGDKDSENLMQKQAQSELVALNEKVAGVTGGKGKDIIYRASERKGERIPAAMYVTLKDGDGNSAKFIAKADTKGAKAQTDGKVSSKSDGSKRGNAVAAAETLPQFPGGEAALMQFLADNVRYPEAAMKANRQGCVVVRFVVSSTGKVTDAEVVRSQGAELDAEALRVVNSMPDFTPGTVGGKAVSCNYTIPISFKLKDDKPAETAGGNAK